MIDPDFYVGKVFIREWLLLIDCFCLTFWKLGVRIYDLRVTQGAKHTRVARIFNLRITQTLFTHQLYAFTL